MIKISCCIPGGSLMPEGVAGVPEGPVGQIVSKCRYLLSVGYDCTECAGGMVAGLSDGEVEELVRENEKDSLGLVAVNSLFPGDWKLADPDADHAPYLARADKIFSVMEKLGASYAVFGSGVARSLIADKESSRETLYGFVKDLAHLAKSHRLTLVIEPLRKAETNIFVTVPEAGEIILDRLMEKIQRIEIPELLGRPVSVSVGVAFYRPSDRFSFEELYRRADRCTYLSKKHPGCYVTYYNGEGPEE